MRVVISPFLETIPAMQITSTLALSRVTLVRFMRGLDIWDFCEEPKPFKQMEVRTILEGGQYHLEALKETCFLL